MKKHVEDYIPLQQYHQSYGLPKIHKPGIPLRPIVSSIGAAPITLQRSWPKY